MKTRKVRPSIYKDTVVELNVTEIMLDVVNETEYPDWIFSINHNWDQKVQETLGKLDFHRFDFYFRSASYWSGILYAMPFDELLGKYQEEDILNIIKSEHLSLTWKEEGLVLAFSNPTKSPLYRFFNKYKEDGCGLNIPSSINELVGRIEQYLQHELRENMDEFGEWESYEIEEEVA